MNLRMGVSGLFQLVWLGVVAVGLWLLAGWLQLPVSPSLDAIIGVFTLLWLYFVVTVPWNMVFQAKQVLFDAQTSRQRGIQIDPDAVSYAQRWARIALWVALGLHVFTALVLCAVAYSGVGLIGWLGAGAAIFSPFCARACAPMRMCGTALAASPERWRCHAKTPLNCAVGCSRWSSN